MHYLPFGDRLNKGILMVTQLNRGFLWLHLFCSLFLEQVKGIEPSCSAWEADILPLNYSRIFIIQ